MAKAKVYNLEGREVGERELPAVLFDVPPNVTLVHSAVVAQMANIRRVLAHTKDRGEVRGGGRKPWKQKHTGRARHGSIRSPLWVGGGVTFGPTRERNFKEKINRKARRKAFLIVLSERARGGKIILVDALTLGEPKTKLFAAVMKKLPARGKTLLVVPAEDKITPRAARNLAMMEVTRPESMNVVQTLAAEFLVMPILALERLESIFAPAKKTKVKS